MDRPLAHWTASFLWPYRVRVAGIALLSVVEIVLIATAPWTLKLIVDHILIADPLPTSLINLVPFLTALGTTQLLVLFAVVGLFLQIGGEAARMTHTQLQVDMGQRIVHDLRSSLLTHLQALPLKHHVTHSTSDSVYRLEADTYCVNDLVTGGVFPLALAGLNLAVMFSVLLQVDATLALMTLGVTPFLYLCLRYHTTTLSERAERVKIFEARLIERAYETLRAIAAIKSFSRESHEHARFEHASKQTIAARLTLTWKESLFSAAVTTVTLTGTALILVVGGMHVLNGSLQLGTLLVVIAYMAAVYDPISSIAHTIGSLQNALVSAERVRDILSLEPEIYEPPNAIIRRVSGHIRFENVTFTYDGHRRVLDGITFDARPGELVAIVGLTGAGKTTLVNLIPRLFDPISGHVLIDDVDVIHYSLQSLREQVALAPQAPVLFAGTIRDNIRFGRLEAQDAEVERAARASNIHSFIAMLPKGYDTVLGEDGATLSGGERQRLGIARAILKNAPILILDEPTSAVDSISEAAVFETLRKLRSDHTTLVIAHRLSTIRDATRIVVLHHGHITAQGTHNSLLNDCELYRQLWSHLSNGRSFDERTLFESNSTETPTKIIS